MFTDIYTASEVTQARHNDLHQDAKQVRTRDMSRSRVLRLSKRNNRPSSR